MLSYTTNLIKTSVPGYRARKYINEVEQAKNLIAKTVKIAKRANLKTVHKDSTLKKQNTSISKQKRVKFKKR